MKKIILIIIALSWTSLYAQTPLGEEFTYQGELIDSSGNPHDGLFDFKFTAFDTPTDGTGNNLGQFVADDVLVTDGIFTTLIDYSILGDEPFMGDKVWLEISVRIGTTTGGYQQLLPRQQVTATPYATHAQFVGADAISDIEIQDESITAADIDANAVGTSEIIDQSITANDIGIDAVGTTEIIASQVQRRVSTVCPSGEFIQSVNQDGTAVCVAETGGLTTVTSADIQDGTIVAVDIDKTQVQKRVGTVCSGGRMMKSIDSDGVATCIFPADNQDLSLSGETLNISDGTSAVFAGWDTNASDDFSGDYLDLTNTPEHPWVVNPTNIAYTNDVNIGSIAETTHRLNIKADLANNKTLRLIGNGMNGAGSRINFGNANYAYIEEPTDDHLTIHSNRGIVLEAPNGEVKIIARDSGSANMAAYVYGRVNSIPDLITIQSSGGFSLSKTSTGVYRITFTDTSINNRYMVTTTAISSTDVRLATVTILLDYFEVHLWDINGNHVNNGFTFVVYRK
jgi:hypothetical protein